MFEKEEPYEIFKLCQSNWSEIIADLSGEDVCSMRVGAVAENIGLYAPPVLDSISVSHVLELSSIEEFDKFPKIGPHTKLVTALVVLNVWQDFKSWKSEGKPIDGASAWIPQRLLLGIPGPQLTLPDWKKVRASEVSPPTREMPGAMNSDFELCEKHWSEIQSLLSGSDLQPHSIRSLADQLGLYWPRKGSDFRVSDFINQFGSPHSILKLRGVGKKKVETIYSVLVEAWRFEKGESDQLVEFVSDAPPDTGEVLSPLDLFQLKWGYFCAALRGSDLLLTNLDQHFRPLGIKCVPGLAVITLQEIIAADSLQGFISTRRGIGKKKLEDLAHVLQRIWATVEPNGPAGPPPPSPDNEAKAILDDLGEVGLEEKIAKVLEVAGVSETTKGIIRKRYGFGGEPPKILEALGEAMGVTRERIRQLQSAGERKVRDHAVANAMVRQLETTERFTIVDQLVKKCRSKLLREKRLRAVRSAPAHCFLLEILYQGSVVDFLDGMVDLGLAQKIDRGWWVGEKLGSGLLAKSEPIRAFLVQRGIPCPVRLVSTKFEMTSAEAEDLLTALGFRTRLGLVFEKKLSAIERRSVFAVLVAVLEEEYVWNESEFFERAIAYPRNKNLSFRLFQRDLSAIDGLIVNTAGPYAILNPLCFEFFDKELAKETMGEAVESSRRPEEPIEPETGITSEGLYGCLWEILENERILKFEQVEERFLATGRTSLGSVGPIMLAHSDIVRYAPGWWGRRGLSLTREDIELLCNPQDLRFYVEAKRGGGLLEMFRFWIPEMEYRWARWAENEADSELFESLLVVIDPDDWPVPDPIRSQWKRKQEQHGFFRLGSPVPDLSNGVADFNSIYGLVALASERGELGYAGISHFLGWRFMNDRRAFSAIAFLVVLGILEETDEPDQPHRATNAAEVVLRRFSETLMERPGSAPTVWRQFVRAKLEGRDPGEDFGWFSMEEFATASKRWIDYLESDEITES